jgi:hypothetical protein
VDRRTNPEKVDHSFYGFSLSVAIRLQLTALVALDLISNAERLVKDSHEHFREYKQSNNSNGESDCIPGDNADLHRWFFYYAWVGFALLLVGVIMLKVVPDIPKTGDSERQIRDRRNVPRWQEPIIESTTRWGPGTMLIRTMYITVFFQPSIQTVKSLRGIIVSLIFLHVLSIQDRGFGISWSTSGSRFMK